MVLEVRVDEVIDFTLRVFCELWSSVAVEDADCIGVKAFELVADDAVFAGSVGFVLQLFDAVIDKVFAETAA